MVIMIGRSLRTAPSTAAFSTESPRARNWLMYSTMMTPVCTDTPNSARNPTPEETLKCVPVIQQRQKAADARHQDADQVEQRPLGRAEQAA